MSFARRFCGAFCAEQCRLYSLLRAQTYRENACSYSHTISHFNGSKLEGKYKATHIYNKKIQKIRYGMGQNIFCFMFLNLSCKVQARFKLASN